MLITPKQAAELAEGAVPIKTIYHYLTTGRLKGSKPFGRWLIDRDEFLAALQRDEPAPARKSRRRPTREAGEMRRPRQLL